MEKRQEGEMRKKMKVSHVCLLLLALLQITTPSSADNTTTTSAPNKPVTVGYETHPANQRVALGEPAVFRCGVPTASSNLTFTFYGSHGNYSLTCPNGKIEDIPQALYGSCDVNDKETLAVWTLKGTSFSDNGTRVVCQQSKNPDALVAVLHVYDDGTNYATLIGCTIGGFFGMLLVAGLTYLMVRRSQTLQDCFRVDQTEEDMDTIVTKE